MPVRGGRSRGRFFPPVFDLNRIDRDLQQFGETFGTVILWYFFDPDRSFSNDIYPEGDIELGGRRWVTPPLRVPTLSANRLEGSRDVSDGAGLYTVDHIRVELSSETATRAGLLPDVSQNTTLHLNDRFIYENKVFSPTSFHDTGQFEPTNARVVLSIDATQLRPDEIGNDVDFADYYDL